MTVLLIFVVLNCSIARYNGRLHCIVGVLPTCYKRKAATYFYPPGGTGPGFFGFAANFVVYWSDNFSLLVYKDGSFDSA